MNTINPGNIICNLHHPRLVSKAYPYKWPKLVSFSPIVVELTPPRRSFIPKVPSSLLPFKQVEPIVTTFKAFNLELI